MLESAKAVPEASQKVESAPFLIRIPAGYFWCRRAIATLKEFQGLIYHHHGMRPLPGSPAQLVPQIEMLIPRDTPENIRGMVVQQKISKLMVTVQLILNDCGVFTKWLYTRKKQPHPFFDSSVPPEQREYDIVRQYFELPRTLENFEILMRTLDQGIGFLEMRKRAAFRELFNPLYWLSLVLRAPLWVFTRAGFSPSQKLYEDFIKIIFAAVLILVLIHYGILNWKDFATWTRKFL